MSTGQNALRTRGRAAASAKQRTRRRVRTRSAALLLAVLVIAAAAVVPLRLWLRQQADLKTLRTQTAQVERENQMLQSQVERLRDPAYLEQLARACLGMVRRGETAFVVIPKDGGSAMETVPCEIATEDPAADPQGAAT